MVWLEFLVFFYYSGVAYRDGSPVPTSTKTEAVTEHGRTLYIANHQKVVWDRLESSAFAGIPSVIIGGFLLHFLVRGKLYLNAPTLRELLARKSSGS